MRKIIKKIATVVAAATMMAAMSVSAFAEVEGEDTFMLSGDCHLFNVNEEENSDFWNTVEESQMLPLVDTVETTNTVYSNKFTCAAKGDWEFKILKNGPDYAWNFQACIGVPDAAWADNQTQFKVSLEPGEYSVYVQPMTGFVCVIQKQKEAHKEDRYHSRDEESENFVEITKAAIEGDGYADITFEDAPYREFVNACVKAEGGTVEEPAAPSEDEEEGNNTMVIVIVVVVVVVVIAAIALLMKKKKD